MTEQRYGPEFKACNYCRQMIDSTARVCPECQRSQNRFSNWVIWLSSAVGLLAFIGSASLFLHSAAILQQARWYGADLEVRNVSNMKVLTVFNNSSADVLLEDIAFEVPGDIELSVVLDQILASGKVANLDVGELFQNQTTGAYQHRFGRNWALRQVNVNEIDQDTATRILSDFEKKDYGPDSNGLSYTLEAINVGGTDYLLFQRNGSDYLRAPCSITINYKVVRGGSFELKPPCEGVVKYRSQP